MTIKYFLIPHAIILQCNVPYGKWYIIWVTPNNVFFFKYLLFSIYCVFLFCLGLAEV